MTSDPWDPTALGISVEDAEREIYAHIISRNPEHDFDPTLDRVARVCELMGEPQRSFKVIHVTGTNGKTSTARMAESLVRAHGLRTGLFTSPHLSTVRERIVIDGQPIGPEDFIRLWHEVAPLIHLVDADSVADGGPRLSFFEVLTVLAFAAFADAPVDVAIIEVGMGGTWDATNVAHADVAVITGIAMDHQQWLGDTIEAIATEKAGIVKDSSAVVISTQSEAAERVLVSSLAGHQPEPAWEGPDMEVIERLPGVGGQAVTLRTPAATYGDVFVPLYGPYQAHNALAALAAVEALMSDGGPAQSLSGTVVEEGFNAVTSPGRMEVVRTSPLIVVDAAHNPAGAAALGEALEESFAFEFLVGVVGILGDKDAIGILEALEPSLDHVVITASSSPRAMPAEDLAALAVEIWGEDRVSVARDVPDALDQAVQIAESHADHGTGVLAVGSVTLVADVRILTGADRRR